MIALHIEVPYASFRKSYARSFAETYPFPPPATVYGMLLSLVGERLRARHAGVQLAFAYARQPQVATTLRKLSRFKYGVPSKQSKLGNAPDFVETLCGIDFICWVDSSAESQNAGDARRGDGRTLEARLVEALHHPERVDRTGIVCLGLSDDAVNEISLVDSVAGKWHWLTPCEDGQIELPVWVDHVGSIHTRWQRYNFEQIMSQGVDHTKEPTRKQFTPITAPQQ